MVNAHMILYIGNPKDSRKKLLQLRNNFSKLAEYKINMQKAIAFLYTNNKLSEKERNNPVHKSIKKNVMLRNKFNQGNERSIHQETVKH